MEHSHKKLIESDEFKKFQENEEGFFLAHASIIKEVGKNATWEFGYYHAGRDRMVIFNTEPISRSSEQEVFKKGLTINPLDISKVKVTYEQAMQIAEKVRQEKYKGEPINKYIVILQNLHKQVWNVTLITSAFNIINIKIDAKTGEVISTNKHSVLDLGIRKA